MKRFWMFLCLFTLLTLAGVQIASAQGEGLQTSTVTDLNVRSGPGVEWRILGVAPRGTTVRLDAKALGGSWVRGITSAGLIGWMSADYLSASSAQIDTLPTKFADEPFTLSAPAQEGGDDSAGGRTVTATARVNIRSGPGTDHRQIGVLTVGAPFRIDGRDPNAQWVRGINQRATVGWVYATYLSISTPAVYNLPVVEVGSPFNLSAPSAAASVPTTTSGTTSVVNTAPVRGFSYGGHVQGLGDTTANWMHTAGMTWVKHQWRYGIGQSPESVSGMINNAHARGFRILIGVIGSNPGDLLNPGYYEQYASFVGGVAALGADAIEVWNEPNIDREWPAGHISPARYTELLRHAYNAIKANNSNTLVISGAPAPTGFFGGCGAHGCDDNLFVSGMAGAGAASYMDCIGVHYNEGIVPPNWTSGDPRNPSNHYTRYFQSMMNVYSRAFGGARPLCFTELGYLTPEGLGPLPPNFAWAGNVSLAEQASWIDQVISIAARSGRVRLVIIWNIDYTSYGSDPMAGYALIRPGGGCPACEALSR